MRRAGALAAALLLTAGTACTAEDPGAGPEGLGAHGDPVVAAVAVEPAVDERPDPHDPAYDASVSRPRRDPVYPALGHPGLDALHYDLDLAWDPVARVLRGEQALVLRATRDAERLVLDLSPSLAVSGAVLDGEPVEVEQRGQDLRVAADVVADERYLLELSYAGTPDPVPAPTTRGDFSTNGWTVTDDGDTWTMQEPSGAFSWYAVDDQPADKATYDISVTVPSPRVGVANGELVSRTEEDGVTTTRWRMPQPMASYLVTVATGEYEVTEDRSASGVPISYWVPADRAGLVEPLRDAPRGLDWLERRLGPYPFDTLGFLLVDSDSGMETQTMVTLGMNEYTLSVPVLVHEMAHHWWGDLVGPDTWRDLWMNEGMVMYLQGVWQAREEDYTLEQLLDHWAEQEPAMREEAGPPAAYDPATFGEGNAYYSGALMWHEIRELLGDGLFWRLVREWPQQRAHGTASYADVLAWWSQQSGRDLEPLFDAWLLGGTSPPR